jgi:glycosyltransferase involved in cell wall biosynthesis
MSDPSLSVIMGAYNIEHLNVFELAMDSVMKQTMEDFEFIICDDGSADNTYEILADLTSKDSRVKLIRSSENEGLASALNHCIAASTAEFIARQDADDISSPDRFEKQLAFLKGRPEISFVGSNVTLYDETGDWGKRIFPELPGPKDFLFTLPFVHGALMFRKKALLDADCYRVAKETRRTEDYDLLMRMYARGARGANIQELLYRFLEDQNAMNRRKYRYRIDEAKVRLNGFRALGLLPEGIPYVLKPLIVGLIPAGGLKKLKLTAKRKF